MITPVALSARRRLVFSLLVMALGLAALAYAGSRHFRTHPAPAAAAPPPAAPAPSHALEPPARPDLLKTPSPPLEGRPVVTARSAILVDAATGAVLWQKQPHTPRPIASTTKIMTGTLVLERLPLSHVVKIAPGVPRTPLVREGLRTGERVPVWKLLDGLLIYSCNDDALALAVAAAGSCPKFLELMNSVARALGLRDTHFTSVSGVIDDGNYSSAWDLAALARYAMRDPRFRKIVRTRIAR